MADQLATPADLAAILDLNASDPVVLAKLTVWVEASTAVVQEAAGRQRILQVLGDTVTVLGTTDSWLDLPQRPVTVVTSVTLDGAALTVNTDYRVFGNRLWRAAGWQTNIGWSWNEPMSWPPPASVLPGGYPWPAPSTVVVVCAHGYAAGAQELQLARGATLSIAASAYSNPAGTRSESIDDYSVSYATAMSAASAQLDASKDLKAALARQYGRRAGLVRVG